MQVPLEQLPHLPNVRGQPGAHLLEVFVMRGCQKAGRLRAVRDECLEEVAPRVVGARALFPVAAHDVTSATSGSERHLPLKNRNPLLQAREDRCVAFLHGVPNTVEVTKDPRQAMPYLFRKVPLVRRPGRTPNSNLLRDTVRSCSPRCQPWRIGCLLPTASSHCSAWMRGGTPCRKAPRATQDPYPSTRPTPCH